MENRRRELPPGQLLEQYRELLQDERITALPLVISGNSMSPFLVHGRDTIYLSRLTRAPRRGDALLYRRDNGAYVFHRVYAVKDGLLTMVGDAQTQLEPGIRPDQVIAVMTAAVRRGKHLAPGCFWWEFFEKIWIRMIPLRDPVRRLYAGLAGFIRH